MTRVEMINYLLDVKFTAPKYVAVYWKMKKVDLEKIYKKALKENN